MKHKNVLIFFIQLQELAEDVGQLEAKSDEVIGNIQQILTKEDFDASDKSYIDERIEQSSRNLKDLVCKTENERNR